MIVGRTAPEIGCWYQDMSADRVFEVVSVDEDDNSVAIQYFEGEIEELELDSFIQLSLRAVDQPEDWSGPYELDREDRFESDFPASSDDYDELAYYESDNGMHIVDDF